MYINHGKQSNSGPSYFVSDVREEKKFSPRKKKLKISTTNLSNNVMRDARRADLERDTTKISDRDLGRVAPTL